VQIISNNNQDQEMVEVALDNLEELMKD